MSNHFFNFQLINIIDNQFFIKKSFNKLGYLFFNNNNERQ